jgi:nicotinamidase-related amidase
MVDKPNLDPARTALLVMDYQVGLLRGLPDAQALLERVNTAVGDVRARGGHIVWVRVAFDTADFDDQLRDRAITTLILAGISTSGVVLSTVREAMDRDYQIVVLEDATADPDPDTHTFLTATIFPRHAAVLAVDDLRGIWA